MVLVGHGEADPRDLFVALKDGLSHGVERVLDGPALVVGEDLEERRCLTRVLDRELEALHSNGVRLVHIGDLTPLAQDLQRRIRNAIELTKHNTAMTVCVAFNYGGRAEIVDAVRRLVQDGVPEAEIDEAKISSYLGTAGLPDPDLIIRTSGEMRLSNFLIWQAAYSEYWFTPTLWPDFGPDELRAAVEAYASRQRKFGRVAEV